MRLETELKKLAEDEIAAQIEESGLPREDVLDVAMMAFTYAYRYGQIERDELEWLANYLGQTIDIAACDAAKAKYMRRKAKSAAKAGKNDR